MLFRGMQYRRHVTLKSSATQCLPHAVTSVSARCALLEQSCRTQRHSFFRDYLAQSHGAAHPRARELQCQAEQRINARIGGTIQSIRSVGRTASFHFNFAVESVALDSAVSRLGVDHLVAVEPRNWLASADKAKLSIFELLQSPSLKQLAGLVIKRSALSHECMIARLVVVVRFGNRCDL
ncbi:hypothetical protein F4801DRAFT_577881 [Xylaria longipes]|nr:hypothetical protein F4801DRAFT_577881 [Xylaria longipes]